MTAGEGAQAHYFDEATPGRVVKEYPVGAGFAGGVARLSRDELHASQERRFAQVISRAWEVPFYARRWAAAGLAPGDIRALEHIDALPRFSKTDLMESVAEAWGGAQVFDWYGVGDTGVVAAEGQERNGLWVFEDAHYLEMVDPDTGRVLEPGETGNQCVTVLFKDTVYPIIRFDTCDLSAFVTEPAESDWTLRRVRGFLGRSDNMVKLRGINVYPTAIGQYLSPWSQMTGEYVCRLLLRDGVEQLRVEAEWRGERTEDASSQVEDSLRNRLGVRVEVALVAPEATAPFTQLHTRQKPVRLIDER